MYSKTLDDPAQIKQIDSEDMLGKVSLLGPHLKLSFDEALKNDVPYEDIDSILFFGLGGSGIAGDVINNYLLPVSKVPVAVAKANYLPKYVGKKTLCISLSYSGNTVETIACFKEAIKKQARTIAITSGGEIEELAKQNGSVLVKLPGDYPPRSALGLLTGAALGCLYKTGLFNTIAEDIAKTVSFLENLKTKYEQTCPVQENPAKKIAAELTETIPLIYGSESVGFTTANRWKAQINENAKAMAFCNFFPELAHNEIIADCKNKSCIVYLKNPDEKAEQLIANSVALRLMKAKNNKIIEIAAEGDTELEKMFSLIMLGDFISVYMAIVKVIDPTPVDKITRLKEELKKKARPGPKKIDVASSSS